MGRRMNYIEDHDIERIERNLTMLRDLIHEDEPLEADDPRAVRRFTLSGADVEVEMSIRADESVAVHIDAGDSIETDRKQGGTEFDQVASDIYFVLRDKENYGPPMKKTETGGHRAYHMDVEPVTIEEEWEEAHESLKDKQE